MGKMSVDNFVKEEFHRLCDAREREHGCGRSCFAKNEHEQWFAELSQYDPKNLIDFLMAIGYDVAKEPSGKMVDGTYTSVWDGEGELTSKARINLLTKEVTILKSYCPGEVFDEDGEPMECECLADEYVTIDGNRFSCVPEDEYRESEETVFWYR